MKIVELHNYLQMDMSENKHLYSNFDPEDLLLGRRFRVFNGQIIFRHLVTGRLQMTNISNDYDYTAHDLACLPLGAPYQLIGGKLIFLNDYGETHRKAIENIVRLLSIYIEKNKNGKLGYTPLDCKFDDQNVLKPDVIFFIGNEQENQYKQITTIPDCVFEVTSEAESDLAEEKKRIYEKAGVREYWKIIPESVDLEIYTLDGDEYRLFDTASCNEKIKSQILKNFEISVNELFE